MSSHQKGNPEPTFQDLVSTFKLIEKKIDKIQSDVNYQGQTLTDLRVMLANLSGVPLNDFKPDSFKGISKTVAMDSFNFEPLKSKRRNTVQPLFPRSPTRNIQGPKYGIKPSNNLNVDHMKTMPSKAKNNLGSKRILRQRKGDAPRKATTLQPKKGPNKKRTKSPQKPYDFPSLIL